MLNRVILILSILILITVAAMGGYYFGFNSSRAQTSYNRSNSLTPSTKAGLDPIIKNQQAMAEGMIIKAENNTITVKDASNNQTTLKLDTKFSIYPADPNRSVAPYTTADIKLNQKALIYLSLVQNEYVVKQIAYETPTPKPSSTATSQQK